MRMLLLASWLFLAVPLGAAPPELIGPFGGAVAVVQVDSSRPGTVLAATSNSLLFRSANAGDSWTRLPFPAELRATLHAFAIAPGTGVYLAGLANDTHEYSGIFRSADGGLTWSRLPATAGKDIWSIAIWPKDSKVIAAGTSDGVFLTRDGGEQWTRISLESNHALMPVVSLDFDPTDSRILYAGTPHLPWKTTNGGATWKSVHAGMSDDSDVFSIHVDPSRPSRVYASACSGLYRSLNQALSWTKLAGARDASYRTYQITQHPTQPNVIFAGTTHGLVRSTDGGTSWRKLSPSGTRWIAFDPARASRIYVATDEGGLFRSDNLGESLRPINEGFCNRSIVSLAGSGDTLYAGVAAGFAGGGIFRNVNLEANWENIDSVSPWIGQQILKVIALDPVRLYVLTSKSILFSGNAGRTWTVLTPPSASRLTALLAPTRDSPRLLVGTGAGIFYSERGGEDWQPAHMPQGGSAIRSLVALGPKSVAAITRSAVLLSPDGINYQEVTSPAVDSEIYGLVSTDHDVLLAATSYGLRRSEDLGATWRPVGGVLGGSTVVGICKHPARPEMVFASRYGAIFSSSDDGDTWTPITSPDEELPAIHELVTVPGIPARLFAITKFQGVYAVPLDPEPAWTECKGRICAGVRIQVRQAR